MSTGISALLAGFLLTALCAKLYRPMSKRIGLVDRPGGHKHHNGAIPLCGGLAVMTAFWLLAPLFGLIPSMAHAGLILGTVALLAIGLGDDLIGLRAWVRFTLQALVVLVFMIGWGGVSLHSLGAIVPGGEVTLDFWRVAFTLFCVVGIINAFNMIDGLDGLGGGFALITLLLFVAAAGLGGAPQAGLILLLVGCVAGFLLYNLRTPWRRRASVFMGDSGSMALGFVLGWLAVELTQTPVELFWPMTMVWIFGLPLLNTGYVMLERSMRGISPMRADNRHFHHFLLSLGLSQRQAVAVWLGLSLLLALIGVLLQLAGTSESVMCGAFLVLFGVYCLFVHWSWQVIARNRKRLGYTAG